MFTISLGDNVISEINQIKGPVIDTASSSLSFIEYEEIAFSYKNMETLSPTHLKFQIHPFRPTLKYMLYTHGLINEGVFSQILSINKIMIEFIHYLSSEISIEVGNRIKENIPKIMKSLGALKAIHDKLPKEK